MKCNLKVILVTVCMFLLVGSKVFSAQPDATFLNYNLRCVYHGMGDGGTQSLKVTVNDFINLGLKHGRWENVSDSEWIYRVSKIDEMTNKKSEMAFAFTRVKDNDMAEFFKDDVLLYRIVADKTELNTMEIFQYAVPIALNIYPMTEYGKLAIEEAKLQKQAEEESRQRQEQSKMLQQAEERQIKIDKENKIAAEKKAVIDSSKNELMGILEGKYVRFDGKKIAGSFDVALLNENEFSLSGYGSSLGTKCELTNKILKIGEYDSSRNVIKATFEDSDSQDTCILRLNFGKYDSSIAKIQKATYLMQIDAEGSCKKYCQKGGQFIGRYNKQQ